MNEITYSIIIPHKDIPQLLQRCLDSIPQREDVQVIVVDDNSDPEKVDFAHFPGLDRSDVECYFTTEGKGAGYARNVGLTHAKGRWLLFADADDAFLPNVLDKIDRWKDSEYDIVYFKVASVNLKTGEDSDRHLFYNENLGYYLSGKLSMNKLVNTHCVPWGKMLSHRFVTDNALTYEEVKVANDVKFAVLSSVCIKKIAVSEDILYLISERTGSLTAYPELWENMVRLRTRLLVVKRVNEYLIKEGRPELKYDNMHHLALSYSLGLHLGLFRSIILFLYTACLLPIYGLHKPLYTSYAIPHYNYSYFHLLFYYMSTYILFHVKKVMSKFNISK